MNMKAIDDYFASSNHKPFFMVVGDAEYGQIIDSLKSRAISFLYVSDCCRNDDKVPDLDTLREKLETADVSCGYNNVVLLGLGEYLALCGEGKVMDVLSECSSYRLGSAQVVLLLRCVEAQVRQLIKNDKRLLDSGMVAFGDDLSTSVQFKFSDPGLGIFKINGIKNVLKALESGVSGEISANTIMIFADSLLPLQRVKDPYEAIVKNINMDAISKECGTEEMWEKLLLEMRNCQFNTDKLFAENQFSGFQDYDLYSFLYGDAYRSWLFYIYLMMNSKTYEGKYLGYVLGRSKGIDSFKHNILNAITCISHTDSRFAVFYKERKRLLAYYPESEMAAFVNENRVIAEESIYRLTDNTMVERQEVIIWIANHGIPENLAEIYPDLYAYSKEYAFNNRGLDSSFAARLTAYFEKYKELKLRNEVTKEFSDDVDQLAVDRIYNRLPKRDELVKEKNDGSTQLFWIDALGVEYLSYIVELVKRHGLKITVEIGRANLPTITNENRGFFDNWPEELRHPKEDDLDKTKHEGKGGYYYSAKIPYAIHLVEELRIINKAISEAATTLGLRTYDRIVIASDHGASRLAVLRHKEEKYDTGDEKDSESKHSGRCCKYFSECDLPFAISEPEQGYVVLADYGRFKGSRASNVEVHGGASLEEVIVPIITLSLRDNSIVISVIDADKIKADYKTGINITLYVNKSITEPLTVGYGNKRYATKRKDDNHFSVVIPDIKKAGTYGLDVYLGDGLVSHIEITPTGKSASVNDDFEDLI